MSFLKKLGETAKNTASNIGAKSANLMELGKLKLEKSQLEGKIKDCKINIGDIVYEANKNGVEPDSEALQTKFNEISDMEKQIAEIDAKIEENKSESSQHTSASPQTTTSSKFCPNCGTALEAGTKFCGNCGSPTS